MAANPRKSLVKNRQSSTQPVPQQPAPGTYPQDDHANAVAPGAPLMVPQPTQAQIQAAHAQIVGQQHLLQQQPHPQAQQPPIQQQPQFVQQQQQQPLPYTGQPPNTYNQALQTTPIQQMQQPQMGQMPQQMGQPPPGSYPPNQQVYGQQVPQSGQPMPGNQAAPFYNPAANPMFGPTGTVQMETKNVTTTSITSVPLGSSAAAPLASGTSGDSDETRTTAATGFSNTSLVPGRITDTEIRLKITGDLPLWYHQEKPRTLKYTKHMLHLFFTGVCALVGRTHIYFLKIQDAEPGESKKHIKVHFSQVLFVKLGGEKQSKGSKHHQDGDRDPNCTYFSPDGGEAMIKTGNKGETHVLIDHFALQKKQPSSCDCKDNTVPCKCLNEARRLILEDPSAYQQFTGTTNCR